MLWTVKQEAPLGKLQAPVDNLEAPVVRKEAPVERQEPLDTRKYPIQSIQHQRLCQNSAVFHLAVQPLVFMQIAVF